MTQISNQQLASPQVPSLMESAFNGAKNSLSKISKDPTVLGSLTVSTANHIAPRIAESVGNFVAPYLTAGTWASTIAGGIGSVTTGYTLPLLTFLSYGTDATLVGKLAGAAWDWAHGAGTLPQSTKTLSTVADLQEEINSLSDDMAKYTVGTPKNIKNATDRHNTIIGILNANQTVFDQLSQETQLKLATIQEILSGVIGHGDASIQSLMNMVHNLDYEVNNNIGNKLKHEDKYAKVADKYNAMQASNTQNPNQYYTVRLQAVNNQLNTLALKIKAEKSHIYTPSKGKVQAAAGMLTVGGKLYHTYGLPTAATATVFSKVQDGFNYVTGRQALMDQNAQLQQANTQLQQANAQHTNTILQKHNDQLVKDNKDLADANQQCSQDHAQLNIKNGQLRKDLNTANQQINDIQTVDLPSMRTQVKTVQGEKATLEGQVNTLQGEKTNLKTDLDKCQNTDLKNAQGEITSLKGEKNTLEGQVNTLQGEKNTLEGQVNTLQGEKNTLEGQVNTLQGEKSTLEGQVNTLQGEKTNLKTDLDTCQNTNLPNAQSDIAKLKDAITNNGGTLPTGLKTTANP